MQNVSIQHFRFFALWLHRDLDIAPRDPPYIGFYDSFLPDIASRDPEDPSHRPLSDIEFQQPSSTHPLLGRCCS